MDEKTDVGQPKVAYTIEEVKAERKCYQLYQLVLHFICWIAVLGVIASIAFVVASGNGGTIFISLFAFIAYFILMFSRTEFTGKWMNEEDAAEYIKKLIVEKPTYTMKTEFGKVVANVDVPFITDVTEPFALDFPTRKIVFDGNEVKINYHEASGRFRSYIRVDFSYDVSFPSILYEEELKNEMKLKTACCTELHHEMVFPGGNLAAIMVNRNRGTKPCTFNLFTWVLIVLTFALSLPYLCFTEAMLIRCYDIKIMKKLSKTPLGGYQAPVAVALLDDTV